MSVSFSFGAGVGVEAAVTQANGRIRQELFIENYSI